MKNKLKLNKDKDNRGKTIKQPDSHIPDIDYPVFCFRYMHRDYNVKSCPQEDKIAFFDRLCAISNLSWNDLSKAHRHGLGWELIPFDQISPDLPSGYRATEDVKSLYAFRYFDKKPFLGVRNRSVFHLLYIDFNRDIYDHG